MLKRFAQLAFATALPFYSVGLWAGAGYLVQRLRSRWSASVGALLTLSPPSAEFNLCARARTSDIDVFRQIFIEREYATTSPLIEPTWIFDCGANVGYSACYFATKYPLAQVIALEPDPENFNVLLKNAAPYGRRIVPLRLAIWSRNTRLKLLPGTDSGKGEWATAVREVVDGEVADVEAVTIASLMQRYGILRLNILKIDIEGGEKHIFNENCRNWLGATDVLVIELHNLECKRRFFAAIETADVLFEIFSRGELTIARKL